MSLLLVVVVGIVALPSGAVGEAPVLTTDKWNYLPGETVQISGTGFSTGDYALPVKRPDGSIVKGDGSFAPGWDTAAASGDGALSYSYKLNGIIGNYEVRAYPPDWSGDWNQTPVASVIFRDAPPAANIEQCRNGAAAAPNNCADLGGGTGWVTGNAGASQSHFVEGYSIPYRLVMTDLPANTAVTVVLGYDIKHSGKQAIDFLTHYDRLQPHALQFGHAAETVSPTSGVSGISGTTTTFPIPAPSSAGSPTPGQPTTRFNSLPAGERLMTLFGGTITNVAYVSEGSLTAAQSETRIAVTFTTDSDTEVLAWGGHIARCLDWGSTAGVCNSAAGISGSPYHMRTIDWNLGNLGNQDRSLSAAAVLTTGTVVINKVAVGGDATFNYTGTGSGIPANFSIATSGGSGTQTFTDIVTGAKTVTESGPPAGWNFTSLVCSDPDNGTTVNGQTANIDVDSGETVTCTYTNTKQSRIVVDKVTSPSGASQSFSFDASGGSYADFSLTDAAAPNDQALAPGNYSVSETVPAGWELTSATCSSSIGDTETPGGIELDAGETVTCTFNNRQDGKIIVVKQTTPDGSAQSFEFDPSYGPNFNLTDGQSNDSGLLDPGTYSVAEIVPAGWDLTSATCSDGSDPATINLAAGETVTCTFNNRQDGKIIVVKQTTPDGSSQSFEFDPSYGPNFNLTDGQSNDSGFLNPGSYSVAEIVPAGWDMTGASCDDGSSVGSINLAAGEIVTCTFNNRQRGLARVIKTVNGLPPTGTESFVFELRSGASTIAAGTVLQSGTADAANGGVINFTVSLVPGQTYQLCELVMPGWMTTLGPPFFTVFNPGGDNSVVCTDFTVGAGETKTFAIDNQPPPGGLARTIGFWKNWASCAKSGGNQDPMLDRALAAAEPGGILIGDLLLHGSVATPDVAPDCTKAVRILNKSRIDNNKKMASDPAFNLAAQLLAAKLNVAAGAGICPAAVNAINAAQALLDAVNFDGKTHANMSAAQVAQANSLANTIDRYNNNTLC